VRSWASVGSVPTALTTLQRILAIWVFRVTMRGCTCPPFQETALPVVSYFLAWTMSTVCMRSYFEAMSASTLRRQTKRGATGRCMLKIPMATAFASCAKLLANNALDLTSGARQAGAPLAG